jgi:hypothetical protein
MQNSTRSSLAPLPPLYLAVRFFLNCWLLAITSEVFSEALSFVEVAVSHPLVLFRHPSIHNIKALDVFEGTRKDDRVGS